MPIYEYRCNHCGQETEAIQRLSDAPLTLCPACATEGLKKKISATVFRLRGSGWYETDFKSDRKKNVAGDDNGGPKDKDKSKDSDQAQQQAKPESDTGKSEKNGKPERNPAGNSKGESKGSTPPAASSK